MNPAMTDSGLPSEEEIARALCRQHYIDGKQSENYADMLALSDLYKEYLGKARAVFALFRPHIDSLAAQLKAAQGERDNFLELLEHHKPSVVQRDMQIVMDINNTLLAERDAALARVEVLEGVLRECAAEYRSPTPTVTGAVYHVAREFKRRVDVARAALSERKGP